MHPLLAPFPVDVVNSIELDTKFFPLVKEDLKLGGAYFGVPLHFDSLALFINMDLFRASGIPAYPATWDDLISAANTLTVRDADEKIVTAGVALGTYDNIEHASDIISLLLLQNGADLRDLAGPTKQSAVDALYFYTLFAKGDARVWDDGLENSKLAFAKGKVAMYIGYSWDIFDIKSINPNLQFAITSVPHILNRDITVASYWAEGVSNKTPHRKEAFEFLKFVASRENLEKLYSIQSKTRLIGSLYPRSDMADLLSDNSLAYPFVSQGGSAKSTIFSSNTYDERMVDELNKYLGDAVRSIVNDNSSAESAVETLAAGVAQKLSQYEAKTK
jgi:multiple sugar transport system substrate-binding protein